MPKLLFVERTNNFYSMSRKHFWKYLQSYQLILSSATAGIILLACSTTKKVPEGEYLLTKNTYKFEDGKLFSDQVANYVSQKPNKKQLFLLPVGLWLYNAANPKYDSMLTEYMTYPSQMRNQALRDSLLVKYHHPEDRGKNLFVDRFLHNVGKPPVILDEQKTETSATSIRKFFVYRGYWDAGVKFKNSLDSSAKKAQTTFLITHRDPTKIKDYNFNIPDPAIRNIYESNLKDSYVMKGDVLDQRNLELEIKRVNELMKANGYYRFNSGGEEIYFTADTLQSRKLVPLTMDLHKDSADSPYKKSTIGNIDIAVVENPSDFLRNTEKDSLRGIRIHRVDNQYKTRSLWLPVTIKTGEIYNQKNLDLTKRNIIAMNNFSIIKARDSLRRDGLSAPNDSIIDVLYLLKPLPKYELRVATDINYSQILNLGLAPSVDLTTRNIFGGAENLTTSISGTVGSVKDSKNDGRKLAYEISAQAALSFPRLLLPFKYWRLIPKRYSPISSINLGASVQNNIGLGRIGFNGSLNYYANINDITSHRLTLFNTQVNFTRNKDAYYDFFPGDNQVRADIFNRYKNFNPSFNQENISYDDVSRQIVGDQIFQNQLDSNGKETFNIFRQSLINKDRQTQDVLISSFIYNYTYNEIGKKDRDNPFYFNGKLEVAGNVLSLIKPRNVVNNLVSEPQRTIFNIPYSQFVKADLDVRKYLTLFKTRENKHTLAFRQFIGVGIPYGNSKNMPFIRSYFNGGANDIRAWPAFGGLGPSDSQLDERIRYYMMDNLKLTTNVEYRFPLNKMFEGAVFTDAGNIWSLRDNGLGDEFRFKDFMKQMGVGSGLGLRINVAYITLRLDAAYKIYDPNQPDGDRWRFDKIQPLKPTLHFAFGYPF